MTIDKKCLINWVGGKEGEASAKQLANDEFANCIAVDDRRCDQSDPGKRRERTNL